MSASAQHEALRHRRYLIGALGVCLLVLFVSGVLLRQLAIDFGKRPDAVAVASATLLIYAFAVLRRPGSKPDNLEARSLGLKWGVAVGCLWIIFLMEPSVWLLAPILPLFAGALGAIGYGKVRGVV
jgi:energy-converting hydrogenase Eha subunit G